LWLISADRDFVPVGEFLQSKGIKVIHGCFPPIGSHLTQKCWGHSPAAPLVTGPLLAVADDNRSDKLPGVPTTSESGFPELQGAFWACVAAPASTPEAIVSRLNQSINRILQSPEIEASLAQFGAKTRIGSPQDLTRRQSM
jgi:tripartite-type tricarboxylate transporter receptor subunit TctC